ncbi:chromo domain-containing protein [Salmonella enterica]|nr:chromo domain-containing protein [Salmonella enterica]
MKKWADLGRRPQEFKVGDLVLVKLQPASLQFFRNRVHKGLVRKYEGPFPIISRVGNVSYKLQLPAWFKIHNVLHASNLKAYHSDPQDASRSVPTRLPPITASYEKRVETILADRKIKLPNGAEQTEYLVKWRKLPRTEASWEPEDALRHEEAVINNYQQASTRASTV